VSGYSYLGGNSVRAAASITPCHLYPRSSSFGPRPRRVNRCLRIVAKIGGPAEKQRARALFCTSPVPVDGVEPSSSAEQEAQYWADSRYPPSFLPLLPIRVFPTQESAQSPNLSPRAGFFSALEATCRALLMAGGHAPPTRTAVVGG